MFESVVGGCVGVTVVELVPSVVGVSVVPSEGVLSLGVVGGALEQSPE